MLPPAMWETYWELCPSGREQLPATVPYPLWKEQMAKMNRYPVPPAPPIIVSYWGKVKYEDEERFAKERKKSGLPERKPSGLIHGPCPSVPLKFWEKYFSLYPLGHVSFPYEPADGKPAYLSEKPRYMFRKGTLCVRVEDSMNIYVPSTGCDELDASGFRVGPG